MNPNNKRRFLKTCTKWSAPVIITSLLPTHAQATSQEPPETTPTIDVSNISICVTQFVDPTDLSGANGAIGLTLTGDVIVSPPGLGDINVRNFVGTIIANDGSEFLRHEPPDSATVTPDANGVATIDGLPLTTFFQTPILPFLHPITNAPFYPLQQTASGEIEYGGTVITFDTAGTVAATMQGGTFTLSSPDTAVCS